MTLTFSQPTRDFINCVTNPLDSLKPSQVPDLQQFNSLCLVDSAHVASPNNPTLSTAAAGVLFFLRCHYSNLDSGVNSNPNRIYTLNYFPISSTNFLMVTAAVKYISVIPVNMLTILGDTQYDPDTALITSCRVMSMGLQVLSTVETVTNTSSIYCTQMVGAQLSMSELQSILNNQTDVLAAVKNSSCAKIFSNAEGCTTRYDPFQNEDQLSVLDGTQMYAQSKPFDWYKMPVVVVKFSQTVASGSPMPVIANARFWIEAALRQPTPIYSQPSPTDPNFPLVRSILSGCSEVFPLVTKGHSFTAFVSNNPKFLQVVSRVLKQSSVVVNRVSMGRTPIKARKPKPKKKKNGNGTGSLAGKKRLKQVRGPVMNYNNPKRLAKY